MLEKVSDDWTLGYIKDDPVRPHLPMHWRVSDGREVYCLRDSQEGNVRAVVCVAYTNKVAITEDDLEHTADPKNAMFYTVWSYDRGAGREIIFETAKTIKKEKPHINRFVTLSPLTEMAEKFHLRNGAKLVRRGNSCQNFEYVL